MDQYQVIDIISKNCNVVNNGVSIFYKVEILLAENSSATTNGTASTKHFITENTKALDELPSNQSDCNEQQHKELVS